MKEYWIKYALHSGHESIVIMPSKLKLAFWLLRHAWHCTSIKITVMWDA